MTNDHATSLVQAGRSAWRRAFAIGLSCAVAALVLESTTAAYARMGENAITELVELTPDDDTVQRFCTLGNACGDDTAVSGNFGGVWRSADRVEPDPRTFNFGIIFVGKVLSAVEDGTGFDVYCSTEGGVEACVEIEAKSGDSDSQCPVVGTPIIDIQTNDCPTEFDYKLEYAKGETTVLKTCKPTNEVVATCLADDSALVTNGEIAAYRALFDYDCVRYCGGGCCRF